MGLFNFFTGGVRLAQSQATPTQLASPFSDSSSLEAAIITDVFGEIPAEAMTREVAQRIPELKRALGAHQAMLAPLRFEKYVAGSNTRAEYQPFWVSSCAQPGMSRHLAFKALIAELFWEGFAVLGAWLDLEGNVYDWICIPRRYWQYDDKAEMGVTISEEIPAQYRQRTVLVPLGAGGVLTDGIDTIRQARKLELARQSRLDAPPAATELHITEQSYDNMTPAETAEVIEKYKAGRNKHSISVTPSYIEVKERGTTGELDLFEGATNSVRIALAHHAAVPADFLEAGKEGGANGQMRYQNANGELSDFWVFGSQPFALAIAAALSADEVVGAGAEVRADTSAFAVPAPLTLDPEAGDASTEVLP